MILARHRPKMGDVIYSLPLLRHLAERVDPNVVLLLDPKSPHFPDKEDLWRDVLFPQAIPYLRELPYLTGVRLRENNEEFTHDLDAYMATSHMTPGDTVSIVENHFRGQNLDMPESATRPWLVPVAGNDGEPVHDRRCIVSHSGRYVNPTTTWRFLRNAPPKEWCFVGYDEEHDFFCHRAGLKGGDRLVCADLLNLVAVLTCCEIFMGNQSLLLALALGLGKKCFVEESVDYPNCRVGNYVRLP